MVLGILLECQGSWNAKVLGMSRFLECQGSLTKVIVAVHFFVEVNILKISRKKSVSHEP